MRYGLILAVVLVLLLPRFAHAQTATAAPTHTPELDTIITVIPPGGDLSDAQDAVVTYRITDGDILKASLLFVLVVLLLLNGVWELRRREKKAGFS